MKNQHNTSPNPRAVRLQADAFVERGRFRYTHAGLINPLTPTGALRVQKRLATTAKKLRVLKDNRLPVKLLGRIEWYADTFASASARNEVEPRQLPFTANQN